MYMKKLSLFFIESLFTVFVCAVFYGCHEETTEAVPPYTITKVSKCERDNIEMYMWYNSMGLSDYKLYENGVLISSSTVNYKPGIIKCSIRGINYEIFLANTKGGFRIETLKASDGNTVLYTVDYSFDKDNRLEKALISGSLLGNPGKPESVWVTYKYEGNKITVSDGGSVELSTEENVGNVCNVLDFAGSPNTSTYVINPDLYFLKIYGTPISKLPRDQEVSYTDNNQLSRVGKYYYEY